MLKSSKLEGEVIRTSVEMVHISYRAMIPRIVSFVGRLIRTAPFRKVMSSERLRQKKKVFFQKTDFYNCRAVTCGQILCVNLSDEPEAVNDAL